MKVKLLAGQGAVDGWKDKPGTFNPERYEAFIDVFGRDNFGVVLAGDVLDMQRGGGLPPVYYFTKGLWPERSSERGLESDLLLASTLHMRGRESPTEEEVAQVYDCIEAANRRGEVRSFMNSRKGKSGEDKISAMALQSAGFPTPVTYHFTSSDEFNSFIKAEPRGGYIIKPRHGNAGKGIFKVTGGYVPNLHGVDISNYVVQEECDIASESRIIFLDGEFMGARMITDRVRPWEVKGVAERKHIVETYIPSKEEIRDSRAVLKFLDIKLGCVDWVYTPSGERFYMEANGVGTGLGKSGGPYNLNHAVAEKLKKR